MERSREPQVRLINPNYPPCTPKRARSAPTMWYVHPPALPFRRSVFDFHDDPKLSPRRESTGDMQNTANHSDPLGRSRSPACGVKPHTMVPTRDSC